MSVALLQKIQLAKRSAVQAGEVIQLRKKQITMSHIFDNRSQQFVYTWFQTPTKVGIQIPYVVEHKEDLKVTFEEQRVTIDFPLKDGTQYHLDLELYNPIIPARSKKLAGLEKIQITMEKKEQKVNWIALRKDGKGIAEGKEIQPIIYPSSSKTKRNWDKIDKQITQNIQNNAQQYGQDPSMAFFKQIFQNADQQKRKAMIKSFQTSGGTVLSTDWQDVAKKDYEGKDRPSPPKGQEWRKRQI